MNQSRISFNANAILLHLKNTVSAQIIQNASQRDNGSHNLIISFNKDKFDFIIVCIYNVM